MTTLFRCRRLCRTLFAGWCVFTSFSGTHAWAQDDPTCPTCHKAVRGRHSHAGEQGHGKAPFQGFGLGYHLGYGYGGRALGVGPDGGYPYYAGPGYPHPAPVLNRWCGINPFPFYGGPGGPTPECPNSFAPTGPLVGDDPVIEIENEPGQADTAAGYGAFTGVLPYPESAFAPFTSSAAGLGPSGGEGTRTAPPKPDAPSSTGPDASRAAVPLGVEVESIDRAGSRVLKVASVAAGGAAERAGLRAGDAILSANGYATELPGHLTWVLAKAAPQKVLRLNVEQSGGGEARTVTMTLP